MTFGEGPSVTGGEGGGRQSVHQMAKLRRGLSAGSRAAAVAAHQSQVNRAVERTLRHRSGRRLDMMRHRSSLEGWGPLRVVSASASTGQQSPSTERRTPATPLGASTPSPPPTGRNGFLTAVGDVSRRLLTPRPPPAARQRQTDRTFAAADRTHLSSSAATTGALGRSGAAEDTEKKARRRQRLRRFMAQQRLLRTPCGEAALERPDGTTTATAGEGTTDEGRNGSAGPGHTQPKPRCSTAGPRADTTTRRHPWRDLVYLGSSTFNDAPLETFMSTLSLDSRRPAAVGSWVPAAVDCAAQCVVHLDDVEGSRFRVEVPSSLVSSPIEPLLAALRSTSNAKATAVDGSVFLLTPLVDEDDADASAGASDCLLSSDSPLARDSRLATAQGSFLRLLRSSSLRVAPPPPPPQPRLPAREEGRDGASAAPPPDELAVTGTWRSVDDTIEAMRTLNAEAAALGQGAAIDAWRRYSTTAALYLCLAQAGVCDADTLPFLTVQLLEPAQLWGGCDVRVEMMTSCPPAKMSEVMRRVADNTPIPVAITLPMARKGVLKQAPTPTRPYSIATQPFTDAEVFQLFYLQLVFRAFFDVRFPNMTWRQSGAAATSAGAGPAFFRSDKLGSTFCGHTRLAYEHPYKSNAWLLFPCRSRLLTILDLAHAVIPLYATPQQLQSSAALPLFGTTGGGVPCQTAFGRDAVRWAAALTVDSPRSAQRALEELYRLFAPKYGCSRASIWLSAVPPKTFRCSDRAAFRAMEMYGGNLSRFLISPEARAPEALAASIRQQLPLRDTPFFSATSRPLSRMPSDLSGFPKPMVPSLGQSQDGAFGASSAGAPVFELDEDVAVTVRSGMLSLEHSHAAAPPEVSLTFQAARPPPLAAPPSDPLTADAAGGPPHLPAPVTQSLDTVSLDVPLLSTSGTAGKLSPDGAPGIEEDSDVLAMTVGATSPFTKQESLVTRWRFYAHVGSISIFDGVTSGIELEGFLGRGGSGLVYRGRYGRRGLPVAVKVFIIPDGMAHEEYVRESLTDVSFFVLMNQLDDMGICNTCRAHDFIVTATPPRGLPVEDANTARRGRDADTTQLCYLVTDLMDGTLGRFLTEDEDDFDPFYDTLVNSPLCDGELFQFLFVQLATKAMFDWRVLDLMLNNQLRGDNVGFRYVDLPADKRKELEADPKALSDAMLARSYYKGIIVAFQMSAEEPVRYLRFPSDPDAAQPLRFIYLIDLGQGIQPNVAELTKNRFIGETVVDSCVEDDGFGRYWPLDELYCRYVDVAGSLADDVVSWGSKVKVNTQDCAIAAMRALLEMYYPKYGVEAPTRDEMLSHCVLTWTPGVVDDLTKIYVYRPEPF